MKPRRSLACVLVLGLVAGAPFPSSSTAQEPLPDMVPRELVEALVTPFPSGPEGDPPRELVGRAPEALAFGLPAGSRVIGAIVSRSGSHTAVVFPGEPLDARLEWVDHLREAGWEQHRPPSRSGFLPNPIGGLQFCREDAPTVALGLFDHEEGSLVRIRQVDGERSFCRMQARGRGLAMRRDSPIPSLTPPDRSSTRGGGGGGGGDRWHAEARLETPLSVQELLDHYGDQLRASGWQPLERVVGDRVASEVFRVPNQEGPEWHAVLYVSKPNDESAFPYIEVTLPESRW